MQFGRRLFTWPVVSLALLAMAPITAFAQIPAGSSFQLSCRNISVDQGIVSADCDNGANRFLLSQIGVSGRPIHNIHGVLTAEGQPAGSYSQTCRAVTAGTDLQAECRRIDEGWSATTLPSVSSCKSDIANLNGALGCDGRTGSSRPISIAGYDHTYFTGARHIETRVLADASGIRGTYAYKDDDYNGFCGGVGIGLLDSAGRVIWGYTPPTGCVNGRLPGAHENVRTVSWQDSIPANVWSQVAAIKIKAEETDGQSRIGKMVGDIVSDPDFLKKLGEFLGASAGT